MKDRVINDSVNRITQGYIPGVHRGVDLGWRSDESQNEVHSNCKGTVYLTMDNIPDGSEYGGGWGNYVLIRHPNGLFSRYAHLKSGLRVKQGQAVDESTILGIIGSSGRAYGRHLHYEVQTSSSSADRIDPTPYLSKPIYEETSKLKYQAHIQDIGWQSWKSNGEIAGTTGQSKRLEAIRIDAPFEVRAEAHIQNIGWKDYGKINKDTIIGTTGQGLRLECLKLKGKFKYRVHIQDNGWTCWTNADGIATLGSVGQSLRIEAIQIKEIG